MRKDKIRKLESDMNKELLLMIGNHVIGKYEEVNPHYLKYMGLKYKYLGVKYKK